MKTCHIEDCKKKSEKRNMCAMHYRRWRIYGDPHTHKRPELRMDIGERLISKRDITESGCWNWTGLCSGKYKEEGRQYGTIGYLGKAMPVHRVSYEVFVGPIPDGLQIDHLCMNTYCFNPEHLEAVTPSENVNRWRQSNGTVSRYGTEYDNSNVIDGVDRTTYIRRRKRGWTAHEASSIPHGTKLSSLD